MKFISLESWDDLWAAKCNEIEEVNNNERQSTISMWQGQGTIEYLRPFLTNLNISINFASWVSSF